MAYCIIYIFVCKKVHFDKMHRNIFKKGVTMLVLEPLDKEKCNFNANFTKTYKGKSRFFYNRSFQIVNITDNQFCKSQYN